MRVWPHQNDTGGFFIAVLEKVVRRDEHAAAGTDRIEGHGDEVLLPPQAQLRWFSLLRERFGFPDEVFDALQLAQTSGKYLMAVSSDHLLPAIPEPVSIGMPFIRTQLKYPKLTTAGTMLLGVSATKNVVEATSDQAGRYLARKEFLLDPEQLDDIMETGYVIVRLRGVSLGVGLCYVDERRVLSMYPKLLSRAVTHKRAVTDKNVGFKPLT
jgi:NOL1/NOP2/fmu family ribosome biogenesis protein